MAQPPPPHPGQAVQELATQLAEIAEKHTPAFPALAALGAAARANPEGSDRVVVLARNGVGKSSILDMLILSSVSEYRPTYAPENSEGEGQEGEGEMPASRLPALLEALLTDDKTAEQAVALNRFILNRNPDSALHRDHLAQAHRSLIGFYHGDRKGIGKHTVLLPVGNPVGTTTQVEMRLAHDNVVACCIHPHKVEHLQSLVTNALQGMINEISEVIEQREDDFDKQSKMCCMLTGVDVMCEMKESKCGDVKSFLQTRLRELQQQNAEGPGLLHRELADAAASLKKVLYLGTRENLSSDLHFVKSAIADPVTTLLVNCRLEKPDCLVDELHGAIIDHIDITVPFSLLKSLTLVDVPGLDDGNPFTSDTISKALGKEDHVIAVCVKNLKGEYTLLRYLSKSEWQAKQIGPNGSGRLIVLHTPELKGHQQLEKVWDGTVGGEMQENHEKSKQALTGAMSSNGDAARRFITDRTHFLTVLLGTFCSLGIASENDVCQHLSDVGVQPDSNWDVSRVVQELERRTHTQEFLEVLSKLAGSREQHVDRLLVEYDRALGALNAGGAPTDTDAQVHKKVLDSWRKPPAIDNMVQSIVQAQPPRGTELMKQLLQCLQSFQNDLLQQCEAALTDEEILRQVAIFQEELSGTSSQPTMGRLRRLCTQKQMAVANVTDVVGRLVRRLEALHLPALSLENEGVVINCHDAAATDMADLLRQTINSIHGQRYPQLLAILLDPAIWRQQMADPIQRELASTARYFLLGNVDKETLCSKLTGNLRTCIRSHLKPLGTSQAPDAPWIRLETFIESMKAAIIKALQDYRMYLPALISKHMANYVKCNVKTPLFLSVRNANHRIARRAGAWGQGGGAAQGGAAHRQDVEPCLWKFIYQFYTNGKSVVDPQGENVAARNAVVATLEQQVIVPLRRIKRQAEQQNASDTFGACDGLVHRSMQRNRVSEAMPVIIPPHKFFTKIHGQETVTLTVRGGFIANFGLLELPEECLPADTVDQVQAMFTKLALLCLYIKEDCIPPFKAGNALEAARASMLGELLTAEQREPMLKKMRDIVASEMASAGDAMAADYNSEDAMRWAGLKELGFLARASQRDFIVFAAKNHPNSNTGRFHAFCLSSDTPTGVSGFRASTDAYPLAMILKSREGGICPWFVPMFYDKRRPVEASKRAGAGVKASGNSLQGGESEARRALMGLADLAALDELRRYQASEAAKLAKQAACNGV